MASEMIDALSALAKEKDIDELELLSALERSLAETYADIEHLDYGARVTIDRQTGSIYVYELVPQGEPDEETGEYQSFEEVDITPSNISRLAAHKAKGIIMNLVREASRKKLYNEFSDRIGELITGTVLASSKDSTVIKIRDGVEAELPHGSNRASTSGRVRRSERPQGEYYEPGKLLKAVIIDVIDPSGEDGMATEPKGTRHNSPVIVSRTHTDFLHRLFEIEVPEVEEGIVEIHNIARNPGVHSKVAVLSRDMRVDPVGTCVGLKGARVKQIVSELRGERVDIVPHSDNPAEYIGAALQPAKVTRVQIREEDEGQNRATIYVPLDQLTLAIGKKGENVALAAKLTGWHLDIKPDTSLEDLPVYEEISLLDMEDGDDDPRCAYVDENGNRCRNHKRPGSDYCGVHDSFAHNQEFGEVDSLI